MDAIKSEISQDLKRNLETPLTDISKCGTEEIHSSFLPHTLDGNYDVGGKRLCNIKDPVDAQDCATMIYVAKQNKELRRYLDSVVVKLDGIIWKQLPALELHEKDLKRHEKDLKSKVNIHEKEIGNLLLLENKTNVRLQSLEDKINDSERRLKLKQDFLENGLNNIQHQLSLLQKRIEDLEKK
ncbi:hypothetical protein QE152_g37140 [Popillia japonica]|uniref:Uncharacterized protein n=1 Tax=Popillia japonica TaxID=7064 RepID=A0AAW1IBG7_POPJA